MNVLQRESKGFPKIFYIALILMKDTKNMRRKVFQQFSKALQSFFMQAQLAPLQRVLCKLQYESKAVASQLEQFSTAASLSTGGGTCLQQMQDKAQALQQCIDDKLQEVWSCLCSVTLAFRL